MTLRNSAFFNLNEPRKLNGRCTCKNIVDILNVLAVSHFPWPTSEMVCTSRNETFSFWLNWGKVSPSQVTGTLLPASGPTVTGGNIPASNALSLLFWKMVVLLQHLRISSLSTSIQSFLSNIPFRYSWKRFGFPGKWKGINLFNFQWKRRKSESYVWTSLTHSSGACLSEECWSSSWSLSSPIMTVEVSFSPSLSLMLDIFSVDRSSWLQLDSFSWSDIQSFLSTFSKMFSLPSTHRY